MSKTSFRSLAAVAGASILSLALVGTAVAQDEEASPVPAAESAQELRLERQAQREERKAARDARKAERALQRGERKAERDARMVERATAREERKAERAERREGRRAERAALRAAWDEVRDDCTAELRAVRTDAELDRAARREALREARDRCRELLLAARDEFTAAAQAMDESAIDERYSVAASDGTGVVRTDLGIAEPGSAPGQELGLWHYRIPPATDLPPHTHPGWQLARVTDGVLEYTVLEGEGVLLRGDDAEPMGPGTYVLEPGDGVIENPDLVHAASNAGDEPVTIISATLFAAGADISTLVDADEPSADGSGAAPEDG